LVHSHRRSGTFLIEDGLVKGGVRNLRFNQSILDALKNVTFASDSVRTGGYSYSTVVPTAKIENFTFTSTTEF
jgi:predicted Zn-dependent protease